MNARTIALMTMLVLSGCGGHAFETAWPTDFVRLEDDEEYDFRAVSAHGVAIGIREVDNDPEGNLQFWADAIRNRLRTLGGYALLEEKQVRAASGEQGVQMRFGRDEGSRPYLYWITVFVTEDYVFIIETGGKKDIFEQAQPRIERTIARFEIS